MCSSFFRQSPAVFYYLFPFESGDWGIFFRASGDLLNPYSEVGFVNPPWVTLILAPFHLFPFRLAQALNAGTNFAIFYAILFRRNAGLYAQFLVFTSIPFLLLLVNGGIEWIPALGFLIGGAPGVLLVAAKPQTGILGMLPEFTDRKAIIQKGTFLLISGSLSFLIWPSWPMKLYINIRFMSENHIGLFNSVAPFPYLIPLGIFLLYYLLWKKPKNSNLLGIAATLCLIPYYTMHSLTLFITYLSEHHRLATIVWIILWIVALFKWAIRTGVLNI
jgi:hypothetical protein